jgi:hypothetical protein
VSDELISKLRRAAPAFKFPPTPELADTVARSLASAPDRPRVRSRSAVLGVACALVTAATLLGASEGARSALTNALDLVPGVEIVRAYQLPARTALLAEPTEWGSSVRLEEARNRAPYALRLPSLLPEPKTVYVDESDGGTAVTVIYGLGREGASIVLTQWHPSMLLFRKVLRSPDAQVTTQRVDGVEGLWILGDHEVFYVGMDRRSHRGSPALSGAALVWQRDAVTYRLEGDLTLEDALAVVRSLN